MRAVLERCQHTGPQMHSLITLGAQHQVRFGAAASTAASSASCLCGKLPRATCTPLQVLQQGTSVTPSQ